MGCALSSVVWVAGFECPGAAMACKSGALSLSKQRSWESKADLMHKNNTLTERSGNYTFQLK